MASNGEALLAEEPFQVFRQVSPSDLQEPWAIPDLLQGLLSQVSQDSGTLPVYAAQDYTSIVQDICLLEEAVTKREGFPGFGVEAGCSNLPSGPVLQGSNVNSHSPGVPVGHDIGEFFLYGFCPYHGDPHSGLVGSFFLLSSKKASMFSSTISSFNPTIWDS